MKSLFGFLFFIFSVFFVSKSFAQDKGVQKLNSPTAVSKGKTLALVVGISEYQNSAINLNFADNDAELFKDFLISSGTVAPTNIESLFNSNATGEAIITGLQSTYDKAVEGDTVFLYFSGHGDVQKMFGGKIFDGYFLGHDVNATRNYTSGGVLPLKLLEEALDELSSKKVKVNLFLDACHSGFEEKVNSKGSADFNKIAHGNFANVTKYLSSQQEQLSYEFAKEDPVQHGYFTYFLIKGLMGLADQSPKDNKISFNELSQYVLKEVYTISKEQQTPKFVSENLMATVQKVKPEMLQIALQNTGMVQMRLTAGLGKSLNKNNTIIADNLNPAERVLVDETNKLLAEGESGLLKAVDIFFSNRNKLSPELHRSFRNLLVKALSIKPQQAINTILLGKNEEPPGSYFMESAILSKRAASLLDPSDYFYKICVINDKYLTAYSHIRNRNYRKYNEAEKLLQEALKLEPSSAFLLHGLGLVASYKNNHPLAEKYFKEAITLIPTWTYPRTSLGNSLRDQEKYKEAISVFEEVISMAPDFAAAYNNLAHVYQDLARYNEAEVLYKKSMNADTSDVSAELNDLGRLAAERGNIKDAEKYYLESIQSDEAFGKSYANLGYLYAELEDKRAEDYLKKAVEKEPFYADLITDLAGYYRSSSSKADKEMADLLYKEAILNNPFETRAYAGRGWNTYPGDAELAESYFLDGVKVNGDKPAAFYYLAEWYDRQEKYIEAEANFKRTLLLNPYYYQAYTKLSNLYLRINKPESAEKILLDAIPYFELSPVLFNDIGNFYYASGKTSHASEYYKKALATDKAYAKAYGSLAYTALDNGDFATAVDQFKLANTNDAIKFPVNDFQSLFITQMENLLKNGKIDIARIALYRYLSVLPAHPDVSYTLSRVLYLASEVNAALDTIGKIDIQNLRVQEKYKYWQLLGWIHIDKGTYDEARMAFVNSGSFNANPDQLGLAILSFIKNDRDAAKSYLSKILQIDSKALETIQLSTRLSARSRDYIIKMISEISAK